MCTSLLVVMEGRPGLSRIQALSICGRSRIRGRLDVDGMGGFYAFEMV